MRRAAVALAAALALGCGSHGETWPRPDLVARIADREIRFAGFEEYLRENVGESSGALSSDVLTRLFDQYLQEELLRSLALELGAVTDPAASRSAAAGALLAAAKATPPAAEAIASYYAAHPEEFTRPERVRLRQILVEDRATAERVRRELAAGAKFEDVVRRNTPRGAAPIGSDQGELARDELPPAFTDPVFRLKEGETSAVLAADYGFHVFQVIRRLPRELLPLAAVEGEIRKRLAGETADRLLAQLVSEAESRYAVVVLAQNLPFAYQGRFAKSNPNANP